MLIRLNVIPFGSINAYLGSRTLSTLLWRFPSSRSGDFIPFFTKTIQRHTRSFAGRRALSCASRHYERLACVFPIPLGERISLDSSIGDRGLHGRFVCFF